MQFIDVLKERHSCRSYLPTPLSDETIKKIVEGARLAPSAKNEQPWKFVCIKTETESKEISSIMANYYLSHKDDPKFRGHASIYATAKILESCPAIILVFENSDYIDKDKIRNISALLSIGAAVEHMALTATDLGLGSLWIADTYFVHKELSTYIQKHLRGTKYENFIDDGNRLICAMAVGEIAEPRHVTPRKSLDEILAIINN